MAGDGREPRGDHNCRAALVGPVRWTGWPQRDVLRWGGGKKNVISQNLESQRKQDDYPWIPDILMFTSVNMFACYLLRRLSFGRPVAVERTGNIRPKYGFIWYVMVQYPHVRILNFPFELFFGVRWTSRIFLDMFSDFGWFSPIKMIILVSWEVLGCVRHFWYFWWSLPDLLGILNCTNWLDQNLIHLICLTQLISFIYK